MGSFKRLNPLDWVFLAGESREAMMHVGSLMLFSPPPNAALGLLRTLMDEVRQAATAFPPWNLRLKHPNCLAHPLQAWEEDYIVDVDYHVRRSALPFPGDERELGILVSRLHSHSIDFHRPPWEVHFIEGLEGGRFAIYFKVHHSLVDGYTGVRLLSTSMSSSAEELNTPMFFRRQPPEQAAKVDSAKAPAPETLVGLAQAQLSATRAIGRALFNTFMPGRSQCKSLVAPMQAPKSVINQEISRNRRFATQQFPIEVLKRVTKAHGGTINDIVLTLCSGALRKLLGEQGALPDKPLTAMLPVSIRPKGDPGGGNAIGAILASLATDIDDPIERFRKIIASTCEAKAQLQGMSRSGIMQYSALLMAPVLLSRIPGVVGLLRPAFNLVISNVPGPTKPLYFRGWRMEAYYPLSIPMPGYGLNVTVVGYRDKLDFGFIGCRDGLPHLQRLALYSRQTLEELEAA